MPLATEQKRVVMEKVQINSKDVGSPEVQVAMLGARIAQLTEHFKLFPKDHDSRHGLLMMVSRRKRLLEYLKNYDTDRYKVLVQKLSIKAR
jgi:small subunit ribosomal protein S15